MQHLLGLPDSTPNPHLWYNPTTMPAVAKAVAADLTALQPVPRRVLQGRTLSAFDRSLTPWLHAIAAFKAQYPASRSRRPSRSPTTCWRPSGPTT